MSADNDRAGRWSPRRLAGVGLVMLGALIVALPLALGWYSAGRGSRPLGDAPPLSRAELSALQRSRDALQAVPQALPAVPTAMIDAAATANPRATHLTPAGALALLAQPSLDLVGRAVQTPDAVTMPLLRSLRAADRAKEPVRYPAPPILLALCAIPGVMVAASGLALLLRPSPEGVPLARPGRTARSPTVVLACLAAAVWLLGAMFVPVIGGRSTWSNATHSRQVSQALNEPIAPGGPAVSDPAAATALDQALNVLQSVYSNIVPALQAAAASVGGSLSTSRVAAVIEGDPRLKPLVQLLTGFSAIYGAGVLSLEATASAQTSGRARAAATDLPACQALLALALLVVAGCALSPTAPHRAGLDHRAPRRRPTIQLEMP